MDYDGFLVVMNKDGGMNMLFFRSGAEADRFIRSQRSRIGAFKPLVQGFKFADAVVGAVSIELVP